MTHHTPNNQPCAESPEMCCINCRHYDMVWLNCKFLGFDGIRENPNMRCNIQVDSESGKIFAFVKRTPEEMEEEADRLLRHRAEHPNELA